MREYDVDVRVTPHETKVSVSRRVRHRTKGVRYTLSVLYSACGDPIHSFALDSVNAFYFDFLHFLTDKVRVRQWEGLGE